MYYKLNNFISRLVPSTQVEAYYPQGLAPLSKKRSWVTFDSKTTKVFKKSTMPWKPGRSGLSAAGTLGIYPDNPRYKRIIQIQSLFLKKDGKMVWQKLGVRDRVAYLATLGLVLAGFAMYGTQTYQMMFPMKSDTETETEECQR